MPRKNAKRSKSAKKGWNTRRSKELKPHTAEDPYLFERKWEEERKGTVQVREFFNDEIIPEKNWGTLGPERWWWGIEVLIMDGDGNSEHRDFGERAMPDYKKCRRNAIGRISIKDMGEDLWVTNINTGQKYHNLRILYQWVRVAVLLKGKRRRRRKKKSGYDV